jgi:mRNA interferase MazF
MTSGDILLANLPQADGARKYRPVLLLGVTPPHGDFLVCGLTSHMSSQIPNLDEVIGPADSDFASTGLKSASLVRTTFLALLPASRFKGRIGSISEERRVRILAGLSAFIASLANQGT